MIESFREIWLNNFFENDVKHKKITASIRGSLFRKLQIIDDATCDLDLRSPPGNHFEKLGGVLKGKHSIRVNQQWRLIFMWNETLGKAREIYLDNHDYR
ncbi:MAG: type II toxin-antitoxin system RelE/ParE family toxin [Deltaproteobacteria bacterium]|nr:MAG: type II toxin-antitoxin system RelE/ParE family toxin [Deltaproteobacteria bacterium]